MRPGIPSFCPTADALTLSPFWIRTMRGQLGLLASVRAKYSVLDKAFSPWPNHGGESTLGAGTGGADPRERAQRDPVGSPT